MVRKNIERTQDDYQVWYAFLDIQTLMVDIMYSVHREGHIFRLQLNNRGVISRPGPNGDPPEVLVIIQHSPVVQRVREYITNADLGGGVNRTGVYGCDEGFAAIMVVGDGSILR